jgi:hypothetical protein
VDQLNEQLANTLADLRDKGCKVFGPGPVTRGATTPTEDAADTFPGSHVQIACGSVMVEGFGATLDEAVTDALMKLDFSGGDRGVLTPPSGGGW